MKNCSHTSLRTLNHRWLNAEQDKLGPKNKYATTIKYYEKSLKLIGVGPTIRFMGNECSDLYLPLELSI